VGGAQHRVKPEELPAGLLTLEKLLSDVSGVRYATEPSRLIGWAG
jgi:hypothetical protein